MLCEVCTKIDVFNLIWEVQSGPKVDVRKPSDVVMTESIFEKTSWRMIYHQPSWRSLIKAASRGCPLCIHFPYQIVEGYRKEWKTTELETIRMLAARDEGDEEAFYFVAMGFRVLSYIRKRRNLDLSHNGSFSTKDIMELVPVGSLAVCKGSGDSSFLPNHRSLGRLIGHLPNTGLPQWWITQCSTEHRDCRTIEDEDLPTRLIDVTAPGEGPKLVETAGQKGKYITLSHRWGEGQPLMTTAENYQQHLQCIPWRDVPATFRDAVTVTKRMQYRYLWIDSLCIIQGDDGDWRTECARMDQIFANSACTIAGPAADGADTGFIHVRPRPVVEPCELTLRSSTGVKAATFFLAEQNPEASDEVGMGKKQQRSSLDDRAWILQERLLTPRTLYFGEHQMYFECRLHEMFESQCGPVETAALTQINKKDILPRNYQFYADATPMNLGQAMNGWYLIVEQYSQRRRSMGRDKLPAISGLARRFAANRLAATRSVKVNYLAGLWLENLVFGLLWHTNPLEQIEGDVLAGLNKLRLDPDDEKRHFPNGYSEPAISSDYDRPRRRPDLRPLVPSAYSAPSWSWASCDQEIYFTLMGTRMQNKRYCMVQACAPRRRLSRLLYEIVDASVLLAGDDPYGEASGGQLVIRAKLKASRYRLYNETLMPMLGVCRSKTDKATVGRILLDVPLSRSEIIDAVELDWPVYCMLMMTNIPDTVDEREPFWVAMALQPTGNDSEFRRIGLIVSLDFPRTFNIGEATQSVPGALQWFDDCETVEIKIV